MAIVHFRRIHDKNRIFDSTQNFNFKTQKQNYCQNIILITVALNMISTIFQDISYIGMPGKTGKKRGPRPKQLTNEEKRQKRADANDRERQRMGQLNVAFNHLRNVLPKHGNDRELSKFETVHLAKNYIRSLNELLGQADNNSRSSPNSSNQLNHSI